MNDLSPPVDLTNCDREPIHIPGLIQPFGLLVALTNDWLIARKSANASALSGQPLELGRPVSDYMSAKALHDIRNRMTMMRGTTVERLFRLELFGEGRRFDVAVHFTGGQIVLEAEPSTDEETLEAAGATRAMMARLDAAESDEAFFREGARQVRALTGFDRVMVYRFAPDGSGEVVAEAVKPGIGSFHGLHYPASDIPAQARALYKRNIFRIIADVEAEPSPIEPVLDERGEPLDLSMSILRAVSPIHIEYLRNMGVRASLSLSIVVDDKLWGLFACHHYSPRRPSFERRSVAELFGQMYALRLENRERKQLAEYELRARDIADQLLSAVASDDSLLNDPDWIGDILRNSIPADGVGVWINGNYAFSGEAPDTGTFMRIVSKLNRAASGTVFATDRLSSFLDENLTIPSAGMLAIPISRTPRDYVILFRNEMIRSVRWAGDPHKPVEYGPNGPRLTPRKSFDAWTELVRGSAKPFTPTELRVAETLRATLIEVVLRISEEASANREEASARQELLIAELNHRVRNILGVIRGLVRQSRTDTGTVDEYVRQVDGRIHALARAHNQITRDHWGPAPLRALVMAEASAFLAESADRILIKGDEVYLNPQAYASLALVLHELVTNSAKYGSLSADDGDVLLEWSRNEDGSLEICWQERGGPAVKKPQRAGFGTTIINRSIPYDLGGRSEIVYDPAGVRAHLCLPRRHIAEQVQSNRPHIQFAPAEPQHKLERVEPVMRGGNVLLVEDSLIIALDAEDILRRLGAEAVNTAPNPAEAMVLIEEQRPDLAMFDINLGDTTSFSVADRAKALGIPYLFATGYGEQAQLPPAHMDVPVVQKPYTIRNVARAISGLLKERDAAGG